MSLRAEFVPLGLRWFVKRKMPDPRDLPGSDAIPLHVMWP
jgi:hypothetical protein